MGVGAWMHGLWLGGGYSGLALNLRTTIAFYYDVRVRSQPVSSYFTWDRSLLV